MPESQVDSGSHIQTTRLPIVRSYESERIQSTLRVNGCSEVVVNISAAPNATVGPIDFEVENPDPVFGTAVGLVSITN